METERRVIQFHRSDSAEVIHPGKEWSNHFQFNLCKIIPEFVSPQKSKKVCKSVDYH